MQLPCGSCQAVLEIGDVPAAQIVNLELVSMAVVNHPQKINCPQCHKVLAIGIINIPNIQLTLIPVGENSRIVRPGAGRKPLIS